MVATQQKCQTVKARQARKNMEVWVRVMCFSSNPTNSIGFRLGFWFASFTFFPSNRGAASFFKTGFR
jgi:hypothetical protein